MASHKIDQMVSDRIDIYDQDFREADLSDSQEERVICEMVSAGYVLGCDENLENIFWAPEGE